MLQYFKINNKEIQDLVIKPFAPRQRNYHEIMWIQEGAAKFIIDGEISYIESNSFFVLPKGRLHQFLPNKLVEGQVIRFTEDLLDCFPRLLFSKFNSISHVKISMEDNQSLDFLYKAFTIEYQEQNEFSPIITNLLKTIIHKLNDIKQSQFPNNTILLENIDLFDQFQHLMDKHITEHKLTDFYASKLNITSRKLNSIVKSILNKSTINTISERLLIEAKRSLIYTDKNISNIAYSLGFEDNSYFTKFFKKHTELTPKQFRKLNGK
ncbi:AraC family transcriptional regulator [Aureivirga marina]|uniref:AraC family transcriptional regulator n=1 Tax=Aureivirga marina TaxID=1182451 RepID=UPI0018CAEAEA|nr:helix-turn-helix domain-containing protein [Aureivirga marina]